MFRYFFILGSHPELSIAEIEAVLAARGIAWYEVARSDEVFVIELQTETTIDIAWFGGVVKIGRILPEIGFDDVARSDQNIKWVFGWSVYRGDAAVIEQHLVKQWERAKKVGMGMKRSAGRGSRFVISKQRALSSVIVEKEILKHGGSEFVWIVVSDGMFVGKTEAVQAFEEYGERDYGRPGFDAKSGMLPPKIAKIMVNLAGRSRQGSVLDPSTPLRADRAPTIISSSSEAQAESRSSLVILDPFCGSGTILQEALLIGYTVIGSDKSPSAIKDTKKNLEWLKNSYRVTELPSYRVFQSDIRKLENYLEPASIDAIVTEPYLGPALRTMPTGEELEHITKELEQLYVDAFRVFGNILKPAGKIIFLFPVFQTDPPTYLSARVLPKIAWKKEQSFLYGRPGQKVWREICILSVQRTGYSVQN